MNAITAERESAPQTRRTLREAPRRRRVGVSGWITAIAWVLGVAILLYPTAAAWIFQYNQSSLVGFYHDEVAEADPDVTAQLRNAHAYNEALSSGALLEAGGNVPVGSGQSRDSAALPYADQLITPSGMMARLLIPAIDLDLPIYHGTDDDTLMNGLGHLEGTSLPVGGASTRSVITGHRGLASARMFTDLDKVKQGDTFTLETLDQVLVYRVNDIRVVDPDDTATLHQIPGEDLVTLITCTPLGVNTHRILITGERITPTPLTEIEAAGKPSTAVGFPWWLVQFLSAVALGAAYVVWLRRPYGRSRRLAASA